MLVIQWFPRLKPEITHNTRENSITEILHVSSALKLKWVVREFRSRTTHQHCILILCTSRPLMMKSRRRTRMSPLLPINWTRSMNAESFLDHCPFLVTASFGCCCCLLLRCDWEQRCACRRRCAAWRSSGLDPHFAFPTRIFSQALRTSLDIVASHNEQFVLQRGFVYFVAYSSPILAYQPFILCVTLSAGPSQ